jgi:adenosylhomocysteine nucleosidase
MKLLTKKSGAVIALLLTIGQLSFSQSKFNFAVIISANAEWRAIKLLYPHEKFLSSPWGEYFVKEFEKENVLVFQEGWGKVAAAGATQYVIDHFNPEVLINLGTCGGFDGEVNLNEIILADRTIIYDIEEAMGDAKEAVADYSTVIDLSWLEKNYPATVRKTLLVSADKDLKQNEISFLKKEYHAVAGDWESGAIAYTATKNHKKILILRGVSDLVGIQNAEAYGNNNLYVERTEKIMKHLFDELPLWIKHISASKK